MHGDVKNPNTNNYNNRGSEEMRRSEYRPLPLRRKQYTRVIKLRGEGKKLRTDTKEIIIKWRRGQDSNLRPTGLLP